MNYIFDGGDCGLMTPLSGALGGGRLRDDKGSQERLADFEILLLMEDTNKIFDGGIVA